MKPCAEKDKIAKETSKKKRGRGNGMEGWTIKESYSGVIIIYERCSVTGTCGYYATGQPLDTDHRRQRTSL